MGHMKTPYQFRITDTRNGGLCSEHKTYAAAVKAHARLVAMSRGKLSGMTFQIEAL